ncbi:P-loop containing nucleoside triphosphate hydrolase protein [Thozetella sp. PMI_491]|nr:P-loop containing nucleoside triphosphate hydrolase protein [Thozetella sp. PMI_491]
MQSLERNKSTAEQASKIEDGKTNPFSGRPHSAKYFEILETRRKLPVSGQRQSFLNVYHGAQVVVLSSDTGSGKTTQIPQFVLFDEWVSGKLVACTQPRRLAATSVARRVAAEMDVALGKEVGYKVRFEKAMCDKTRLVYMSDGLLLREAIEDSSFSKYSCVIVDEAHERTLATDMLMALLKIALSRRDDLKVVIMSATLDADKFRAYFGTGQTLKFEGRAYPVDILYLKEATPHYLHCAFHLVKHIHSSMPVGDILLFLPAAEEIERACVALRAVNEGLEVLPLYSALPQSRQDLVFAECSNRKCVVSTNIAEISLTIDGIVYVIDPGLVKSASYDPRVEAKSLVTATISRASAQQRAGRAGRTQPGTCFRLYTEASFQSSFLPSTPPGILETEITSEILLLKAMGHNAVGRFDFVDRPHPEVYLRGMEELYALGFIDSTGSITDSGHNAARFPTHPVWYKALVEAHKLGCSDEMLSLAAIANTQNSMFLRPHDLRYAADAARDWFRDPESDHIMQLNALHAYVRTKAQGRMDMDKWCLYTFLSRRVLEEVLQIRQQLRGLANRHLQGGLKVLDFGDKNYSATIRKALARSFFFRAAIRQANVTDDLYTTVHGNFPAGIHPDSSLIGRPHEWVVYDSFVYTGKQYLETVSAVDPDWLIDLEYFQDDKLSRKRGAGELRQPRVKASLDKAREKRAQS